MVTEKLSVIQIVPELEEGGVEGETLELAVYLAHNGHRSIVISGGGRLVPLLEQATAASTCTGRVSAKKVRGA